MRPQEVDPSGGGGRELGISFPLEHPLAPTMPVHANAPVTVLGPIFVADRPLDRKTLHSEWSRVANTGRGDGRLTLGQLQFICGRLGIVTRPKENDFMEVFQRLDRERCGRVELTDFEAGESCTYLYEYCSTEVIENLSQPSTPPHRGHRSPRSDRSSSEAPSASRTPAVNGLCAHPIIR